MSTEQEAREAAEFKGMTEAFEKFWENQDAAIKNMIHVFYGWENAWKHQQATIAAKDKQIAELQAENNRILLALADAEAVIQNCPEINPSNYDHDDVCSLNAATCEAHSILQQALTNKEKE